MSVDERMLTFVAWHGEIPQGAVRITDDNARDHVSRWIRHNLGRGIVHSYVIGYELRGSWWTLFFERIASPAPTPTERWWIEAYDHDGRGWGDEYLYWPGEQRWEHAKYLHSGDDHGRHGSPRGSPGA